MEACADVTSDQCLTITWERVINNDYDENIPSLHKNIYFSKSGLTLHCMLRRELLKYVCFLSTYLKSGAIWNHTGCNVTTTNPDIKRFWQAEMAFQLHPPYSSSPVPSHPLCSGTLPVISVAHFPVYFTLVHKSLTLEKIIGTIYHFQNQSSIYTSDIV